MPAETTEKEEEPTQLERIQSELEESFCPPLDSSLIAALLSELDPSSTSADEVASLRLLLQDLAAEAALSKALDETPDSLSFDTLSLQDGSQTSKSQSMGLSSGDAAGSSSSGASSPPAFDTPLGFLKTVFPHIAPSLLQRHLDDCRRTIEGVSVSDDHLDMSSVIDFILSEEFVREEQERNFVGTEETDQKGVEKDWLVIERKGKGKTISLSVPASPVLAPILAPKPRRPKPTAIPLVDTLQRQHTLPPRPKPDFDVAPDPWSHLASLASRLAQLVPEMPEGRWLALFHNPVYPTPSHAVRAELQRLSLLPQEPAPSGLLNSLLELLSTTPSEDEADNLPSRKLQDAETCLRACHGNAHNALDLVWLLEEMDSGDAAVVHSAPKIEAQATSQAVLEEVPDPFDWTRVRVPLPEDSTPRSAPSTPPPRRRHSTRNNQWTVVSPRKRPPVDPSLYAANIPAYRKPETQGRSKGKPTPSFNRSNRPPEIKTPLVPSGLSELEECKWWTKEYRRQRDEALRAAGRHWQRGTVQDRGGDVALYYAEQARKLEETARDWAVRAARLQVQQQKKNDLYTIDLHGLTLHESLSVVREGVNEWYSSSRSGFAPNHSLTIITGAGKHSAGQQSVLGPAVFKALERDGWRVVKREAAVVVTGVARG